MPISSKALLSVLVLAATAPLLVAQDPSQERQGPSGDPQWGGQMGPGFGRRSHFRFDGEMGRQPWMSGRAGFENPPRGNELPEGADPQPC